MHVRITPTSIEEPTRGGGVPACVWQMQWRSGWACSCQIACSRSCRAAHAGPAGRSWPQRGEHERCWPQRGQLRSDPAGRARAQITPPLSFWIVMWQERAGNTVHPRPVCDTKATGRCSPPHSAPWPAAARSPGGAFELRTPGLDSVIHLLSTRYVCIYPSVKLENDETWPLL